MTFYNLRRSLPKPEKQEEKKGYIMTEFLQDSRKARSVRLRKNLG